MSGKIVRSNSYGVYKPGSVGGISKAEREELRLIKVHSVLLEPSGRNVYVQFRGANWIHGVTRQPDGDLPEWAVTFSKDVDADLSRMWHTRVGADGMIVSTDAAVLAARRVFRSLSLVGYKREEAISVIERHKSRNSGYTAPFYPVREGIRFYRFDTGNFGCQVEIEFDQDDRVTRVTVRNIE